MEDFKVKPESIKPQTRQDRKATRALLHQLMIK